MDASLTPNDKVDMLGMAIGLIVAAYAAYCIVRGRINARFLGAGARPVLRSEQPVLFWLVIGCQIAVASIVIFAL